MCGLFGFYNYGGKPIKNITCLTNALAEEAAVRGTDATGIAYNNNKGIVIHKEPKSAFQIDFKHPEDVICVTGHTRHSTQGDKKKNSNNHPFAGRCKDAKFALAHNGVIMNDKRLREELHLPSTKIETDSFIAVQLIEKKRKLNGESIKYMAEKIQGSFAFSILDTFNTLWLVRGDSPLSLVHIPKYKLYVYASTSEILFKALVETNLFDEIKQAKFEEININEGDILNILPDGTIVYDRFKYTDYFYSGRGYHWYDFDYYEGSYIDDLKSVASYQGYSPEDVDELLDSGFSPEEIEEYLYAVE